MPNKTMFDAVTKCYSDKELDQLISSCSEIQDATPDVKLYHGAVKELLQATKTFRVKTPIGERYRTFRATKNESDLQNILNNVVKVIESKLLDLHQLQKEKPDSTELLILHSAITYSLGNFHQHLNAMKGEKIYDLYHNRPIKI